MEAARRADLLAAGPAQPRQPGARGHAGLPTGSGSSPRSSAGPGRSPSGSDNLGDLRDEVRFYEEVRVWMAKFDAAEREARGRADPRGGGPAAAGSSSRRPPARDDVVDIYAAAEIAPPNFDDLTPAVLEQAQAVVRTRTWPSRRCGTRSWPKPRARPGRNLVRQRAFSERLGDVDDALHQRPADARPRCCWSCSSWPRTSRPRRERGEHVRPAAAARTSWPTYDAIADNASALDVLGQDVLADIARAVGRR